MILLNRYLTVLYLAVAVLFLAGFGLRLFNRYPGKEEPLALDGSAVAIAILFAYISLGLSGPPRTVGLRIVLILCSSLIIVPHLLYIIRERDL